MGHQRVQGYEDLQRQIDRLKAANSVHSAVASASIPMYARPDTDPFMDDFLSHDITADISGGRYRNMPDTRSGLSSSEPVEGGYGSMYGSRNGNHYTAKNDDPNKLWAKLDTVSEGGSAEEGGEGGRGRGDHEEEGEADWGLLSSLAYRE